MSSDGRFHSAVKTAQSKPFRGNCYRVFELEAYEENSDAKLLFDLGPKISKGGQRFSPPGKHRGLYVADLPVTAGAEFADGIANWENGNCPNSVTVKIAVQLKNVLNLCDASTRRHLGISLSEVKSAWEGYAELNGGAWPPTWKLGNKVFLSKHFDGIRFPSVKYPRGSCLLVFTERLIKGETFVAILKKDGSKWERLP
jgi:hypothetical protein